MYHYTSVDGFEGIIKNSSFRLTLSEYLNDPSDCRLFSELISNYCNQEHKIKEIQELVEKPTDTYKNNSHYQSLYQKADVLSYINYLQDNINFYVLSLTESNDEMNMWNYYGNGGVQLDLNEHNLCCNIVKQFTSDNEYLATSNVLYTDNVTNLSDIIVPKFSSITLQNINHDDVFKEDEQSLNERSLNDLNLNLYSLNRLDKFVDIFITDYIWSIKYLFDNGKLVDDLSSNEIFTRIFNNTISTYGQMIWKRDLLLYILVLSGLIKSNTYQYEHELRLIYFEVDINSKTKSENYIIKSSGSNKYFHPFIEFDNLDLNKAIKHITLSPLSKNLPIPIKIYIKTVDQFVKNNAIEVDDIKVSKHSIRW